MSHRKRVYVEIQGGMVAGVFTHDFDQSELEFVVVDRDIEAGDPEAAEINEFFDNLSTNPNELYQVHPEE